MKRLFCSLTIACALLLPAGAIFTACTTPTQQRTTFNSLYTVGKGVDTAYRTYLDMIVSGKISTNALPRISQQYNQFQTAFGLAVAMVASNTNAPAAAGLIADAATLTLQIESAKKGIQP